MKLTPAQERTLWEIDRAKMGARDTLGRQGWLGAYHWNSRTLRILEGHGLVERRLSDPNAEGALTYVVRLTAAGNQRVPTP